MRGTRRATRDFLHPLGPKYMRGSKVSRDSPPMPIYERKNPNAGKRGQFLRRQRANFWHRVSNQPCHQPQSMLTNQIIMHHGLWLSELPMHPAQSDSGGRGRETGEGGGAARDLIWRDREKDWKRERDGEWGEGEGQRES